MYYHKDWKERNSPDVSTKIAFQIFQIFQSMRFLWGFSIFNSTSKMSYLSNGFFFRFFQNFISDECRCRCTNVAEKEDCERQSGNRNWDPLLCRSLWSRIDNPIRKFSYIHIVMVPKLKTQRNFQYYKDQSKSYTYY